MADGKHTPTRTPGVRKRGNSYRWESYRSGDRGTCATYTEAVAAKQKADAKGPTPQRARGEFGAYARDWLEAYGGRTRRGFGEASRQRYRENLELYAIPYFDTVRKRRFADVKRPRHEGVRRLARTSRAARRRAVDRRDGRPDARAAQGDVQRRDRRRRLPRDQPRQRRARQRSRDGVDPDQDDDDKRAFTVEQLRRVITAAGEHELMLTVLADTGVRWGELSELRGRDLKTTRHGPVLAVRRAWDAKTKTIGRPKGGKVREIPLSPDLARRLWRLQRQPSDLLFVSRFGERLNYQNTLRRVLRPILTVASIGEDGEVDDLTWAAFHTFRHTFATLLGRRRRQHQARQQDARASQGKLHARLLHAPVRRRPGPDRQRDRAARPPGQLVSTSDGRSMAGCETGSTGNSPEGDSAETGDLRDKDPVSLEPSEAIRTPRAAS